MTLHEHRSRFERRIEPFAAWCARHGVGPNTLTVLALLLATAGAAAYYAATPLRVWPLLAGSALLAAGATLDSADGVLARMTGQATPLGDFLDHALDRFADVIILLGLTFSVWLPVEIGLFALVGTLLTSYMGTQAQAVGVGRDYGGLLGRADRMMILVLAPPLEAVLRWTGYGLPLGLNLVYVAVAWIAVAGNITALQRFRAAYRDLSERHARFK